MKMNKSTAKSFVFWIVIILIVNLLSLSFYKRFDLTNDKRYTLSKAALQTIDSVDTPLVIDVFLEGDFPSEFKRLRLETQQILEEFQVYNSHINFNFINPTEDESQKEAIVSQLTDRGLEPLQLNVRESGKTSQTLIFPWALASSNVSIGFDATLSKVNGAME